jgi:hypothetical protein
MANTGQPESKSLQVVNIPVRTRLESELEWPDNGNEVRIVRDVYMIKIMLSFRSLVWLSSCSDRTLMIKCVIV